ncbi:facilitated trehalose transporter Tret1-like [Nesidiocoris tenuis]|uniref:Facilitated trehalose transporter Tret1-like n=1 Tax=Nesidiocoris tenuis TaxID=355587 RepID=A0ABN7A7T9_9HEMI|nr:facilitated trehalose transporter Tret1-like [Nesidiocoris tenuis]
MEQVGRRGLKGVVHQWIASTVMAWAFLIAGINEGWLLALPDSINLTPSDYELMTWMYSLGSIVAPIPCGILVDYMGRKKGLLLTAAVPLTSWILIYFANHSAVLHVAELLAGFWDGIVRTAVPLYIGEIAEPRIRGALFAFVYVLAANGEIMQIIIVASMSYWNQAMMYGIISFIFIPILLMIPESPYWLVQVGIFEKAIKSLLWFRGGSKTSDVSEEFESIVAAHYWRQRRPKGLKTLWKSRGNRKALIIVTVLAVCKATEETSWFNLLSRFESSPDNNTARSSFYHIIGFTSIVTLGSICVTIFVDCFGRVPLLIVSCCGCFLSTFASFVYDCVQGSTAAPWLLYLLIPFYVFFKSLGLLQIPLIIQGEVYPPNYKADASGWAAMVLSITGFITNSSYEYVTMKLGADFNFLMYAVMFLVILAFVWLYVIETKRKTLHQIQLELHACSSLHLISLSKRSLSGRRATGAANRNSQSTRDRLPDSSPNEPQQPESNETRKNDS